MAYRLPPLNALRAFEAAARHLSFSKAAEELFVTPAAISHQIKSLEEHLGVQLFRRMNRALALTEVAHACLPLLRQGFDCLAEAVELARAQDETGILTVSLTPSFAVKWLVPRLDNFMSRHPEIEMRIAASNDLLDVRRAGERASATDPMDFRREDVDVAIRFGTGHYPEYHVTKLFSVQVTPLCSPQLLTGEHPLLTPDDLRYHTLLHDETPYGFETESHWVQWLRVANVEGVDPARGPRFNHASLAIEAAIDGQGVALGLPVLALPDIHAGRLVIPFKLVAPLEFGYWIVCPAHTAERAKVRAFREWLLEEARADELALAALPQIAGADTIHAHGV
ncbi:LysR family glycine cleavage system transcriptional activator [Plasticicumulans lactativorans]|uniref:LysR family glycine cleavage system transcriptional activator n=1 Tax=Plasticicumulans lactativorans TaxID=1133106 RepID=A0A4R2L449_9GAMM|nr:transcriptional regulator GcvA [Plasticicumulans lactativorans]TCO81337.1 LysR family glycine cleavage system transcriptional activator [Plasticicumulans lactativorans]